MSEISTDDLLRLDLHQTWRVSSDMEVTRVLGGFIYTTKWFPQCNGIAGARPAMTSVFVPYLQANGGRLGGGR